MLVVRDGAEGAVEQIEHRYVGTRLGEGLRERGALVPAAIARTLEAVRAFAERARELDARVACIATSAVRRADDGDAFGARVAEIAGGSFEILNGDAEARASYRGATHACARDGLRTGVLDIGGGSTEFVAGVDGALEAARSIEIGSVRVAERFPALCGGSPGAPARAAAGHATRAIDDALAPLRALGPIQALRCVAGTPLTLGALAFDSSIDSVAGRILTRAAVDAVLARLLDATLAERRSMPGMVAQRADIIPAGGLILAAAMRICASDEAVLESDDLLLGYLLERRNDWPATEFAQPPKNQPRMG